MALSIQEYVIRLRAIHQQVNTRSNPDGHAPGVSMQEWTEVLAYAFEMVPGFEPHWREIGVWITDMMALLDAYHGLAGEFLEEEDTVKLPASSPVEQQRGLLSYQTKNRETEGVD